MSSNLADHVYLPEKSDNPLNLRNIIMEEISTPSPWKEADEDEDLPCMLATICIDVAICGRTGDSGCNISESVIGANDLGIVLRTVISDRSIRVNYDDVKSDWASLSPVPIPTDHRSFIRLHNYRLNISCTLLVVAKRPDSVVRSMEVLFQRLPITVSKWNRLKSSSRNSSCYNKMIQYI